MCVSPHGLIRSTGLPTLKRSIIWVCHILCLFLFYIIIINILWWLLLCFACWVWYKPDFAKAWSLSFNGWFVHAQAIDDSIPQYSHHCWFQMQLACVSVLGRLSVLRRLNLVFDRRHGVVVWSELHSTILWGRLDIFNVDVARIILFFSPGLPVK